MSKRSDAYLWLSENGLSWDLPSAKPRGKVAKKIGKRNPREYKSGNRKGEMPSVKNFVHSVRLKKSDDCVFVPLAIKGRPASVDFCGKSISAARYMCILTHGAPKHEDAAALHLCGNGHLSCVNPAHIVWGDASENMSDAVRHRHAGEDVSERILSVTQ